MYRHISLYQSQLILSLFKQRSRLEKSKGFDLILLTLNPNFALYFKGFDSKPLSSIGRSQAVISQMKEICLEEADSEIEKTAIRDHWVFDDMDEDEYL